MDSDIDLEDTAHSTLDGKENVNELISPYNHPHREMLHDCPNPIAVL